MSCSWVPTSAVAKAVYDAGFCYDSSQDIIFSRLNPYPLQWWLGYTWPYDMMSAGLQMIIDCEPFYFAYDGKLWMIELWKGQYGLETGAEIGVYRDNHVLPAMPLDPRSRFYDCVDTRDQLRMKFTLYRNGTPLLHRGPESHFWLTGFKWGIFTPSTRDLSMDIEIYFPATAMRDAFKKAAEQKLYHTMDKGQLGVAFTFHIPRTLQPGSRAAVEIHMQKRNERLVTEYHLLKQAMKITTNDPNAFTQLDGPAHKAAHEIAAAAKLARHGAQVAAHKLGAAAAAAKKLQGQASAAARTLGHEISDASKATYGDMLAFFHGKEWHMTRTRSTG